MAYLNTGEKKEVPSIPLEDYHIDTPLAEYDLVRGLGWLFKLLRLYKAATKSRGCHNILSFLPALELLLPSQSIGKQCCQA